MYCPNCGKESLLATVSVSAESGKPTVITREGICSCNVNLKAEIINDGTIKTVKVSSISKATPDKWVGPKNLTTEPVASIMLLGLSNCPLCLHEAIRIAAWPGGVTILEKPKIILSPSSGSSYGLAINACTLCDWMGSLEQFMPSHRRSIFSSCGGYYPGKKVQLKGYTSFHCDE